MRAERGRGRAGCLGRMEKRGFVLGLPAGYGRATVGNKNDDEEKQSAIGIGWSLYVFCTCGVSSVRVRFEPVRFRMHRFSPDPLCVRVVHCWSDVYVFVTGCRTFVIKRERCRSRRGVRNKKTDGG